MQILESEETIGLKGELKRVDSKLVQFQGKLHGNLELICVRSGKSFRERIDCDLVLYFSDGVWKTQSQTNNLNLDVIEFFEGFIDFNFILESEVESIRLDYNIQTNIEE
ncbi:hypothetical protein [Helicobacter didelphidarum]